MTSVSVVSALLLLLLLVVTTAHAQPRPLCDVRLESLKLEAGDVCGCVFPHPLVLADQTEWAARLFRSYECSLGTMHQNGGSLVCITPDRYCSDSDMCEASTARDKVAPVAKCASAMAIRRHDSHFGSSALLDEALLAYWAQHEYNQVPYYDIEYEYWTPNNARLGGAMGTGPGEYLKNWYVFHPFYLNNGSSDDCGSWPLNFGTAEPFPSRLCHPLGHQTLTLIVADRAGRESTCRVPVNVVEAVPARLVFSLYQVVDIGKVLTPSLLGATTVHKCLTVADFTVRFSPPKLTCEDIGLARTVFVSVTSLSGFVSSEVLHISASDPTRSCGREPVCQTQLNPCRAGTYGTVAPDGTWFCFELMPIVPAAPTWAVSVAERTVRPQSCRLMETNSPLFPGVPVEHTDPTSASACVFVKPCAVNSNIASLLLQLASECEVVVDRNGSIEALNMTWRVSSDLDWNVDFRSCAHFRISKAGDGMTATSAAWLYPSVLTLTSFTQPQPGAAPPAAHAVTDMQLSSDTRADPVTASSFISLNTMLGIALVLLLILSVGMFAMVWRASRRLDQTTRRLDELATANAAPSSKPRRRFSRRLDAV